MGRSAEGAAAHCDSEGAQRAAQEEQQGDSGDDGEDRTAQLLAFGEPVLDRELLQELQWRLWDGLLQRPTRTLQFPGSQPVSFARAHLDLLERRDYYVCEKSDGVRFLLYYTAPYGRATAYLIDRNYECREVRGLTLPARQAGEVHEDTLLDGELICEKGGGERLLFLVFDALLVNGRCIVRDPLPARLKCVQNDVIAPLQAALGADEPQRQYPFRLEMKKMWKPYAIAEILEMEIPKLRHGNDGLIFTPVAEPYVSGTCHTLFKWKPSEMNTVDFRLVVNGAAARAGERYELHVATRDTHRFFAHHAPAATLDSLDGAIIECRYVPPRGGDDVAAPRAQWEMVRVRRDKSSANNENVVDKILASIRDNVTAAQLIAHIPAIRRAWKAREAVQARVASAAFKAAPAPALGEETNKRPRTSS